jgi:uncharacterized protein
MVEKNRIIGTYSKFVSHHPLRVLIISLIVSGIMLFGLINLKTIDMDYQKMLPQDNPVVDSYNMISEEFGGENSLKIAIEIDNSVSGSDEPVDIRDPGVIKCIDTLAQKIERMSYVTSVSSISQIIKQSNDGYIPGTLNEIKSVLSAPDVKSRSSSLISKDNSMALISVRLSEDSDKHGKEIESELNDILEHSDKPAGISVTATSEILKDLQVNRIIDKDMSKTSLVSLFGIILVLFLMFRSVKYGILPLFSIIFGVLWAMGFLGLIGGTLNMMTSGTISMIMGVGIDFGIQIIVRFKYEHKTLNKKKAMEKTLSSVIGPILITTTSAVIGFLAMSLGELTLMADMGHIMSLGVIFCMLGAITVVPSLILLVEKEKPKGLLN